MRQDKLLRVIEWESCKGISRHEVEGCLCISKWERNEDKQEAIISATVNSSTGRKPEESQVLELSFSHGKGPRERNILSLRLYTFKKNK